MCYDCNAHFQALANWAHHRRHKHGVHLSARCYANSDGVCYAWATTCWRRAGLIKRLNTTKPACLTALIQFDTPYSEPELKAFDVIDKKLRKSWESPASDTMFASPSLCPSLSFYLRKTQTWLLPAFIESLPQR